MKNLVMGLIFSMLVAWGGWVTKATIDTMTIDSRVAKDIEQINYKLDLILQNYELVPKKGQ